MHLPLPALFLSAALDTALVSVPTGPLIAVYALLHPHRAWAYVLVGALGSAAGAIVVYGIGRLAAAKALTRWPKAADLERRFSQHRFATIALAAALPVPIKPFVAAAGIFKVPVVIFLLALLSGRILRFGLEALLVVQFGPSILAGFAQLSGTYIWVAIVLAIALAAWAFRVPPFRTARTR